MAFRRYQRSYDDYLIGIGDRVQFKADDRTMKGTVTGRGSAGNYLQIRGDDGVTYEGYSSDPDCRKLFSEDER